MQDILEGRNGNYEVDTAPFYDLMKFLDEMTKKFVSVNLYVSHPASREVFDRQSIRETAYDIERIYVNMFLPIYNDEYNGLLIRNMAASMLPLLEEIRRTCNAAIAMTS